MLRPLQIVKRIANSILAPLGVEFVRIADKISDLNLYPEIDRPEIPTYLNIGAGNFYHPYWHNLDTPNDYYAESQKGRLHINYDLMSHQPLPFGDNTVKVAYTSHVVEHLRNEDVIHLFSEVYRCLQPGGCFRITCPDIDLEYDAYIRGDDSFWKWPNAYGTYNKSIEQKFLDHFATVLTTSHPDKKAKKITDQDMRLILSRLPKEEALNYIVDQIPIELLAIYPGDHINWFNYSKIVDMLRFANFENIYKSSYRQSKCQVLRNDYLFDTTCPELSLYVECSK